MRAFAAFGASIALLLPSRMLHAQVRADSATVARVSGVVFDSVGNRPLAGAMVQLVPASERATSRALSTDESGRYAFDSLSAGRYLLGYFHPLLDSLGLTPPTLVLDVRGSGDVRIPMAVPSPTTLIAGWCGAGAATDSTGVLVGYVRSATDGLGQPKAHVQASWFELVIDADGMHRSSPMLEGETSEAGGVALCGIPLNSTLLVRAWSGADSSGAVELTVPANGMVRRDLYVGAATLVSRPDSGGDAAVVTGELRRGTGVLRGEVHGTNGRPIEGARLLVREAGIEVASRSGGTFQMRDLPLGTYTVDARALGFLPRRQAVDVLADRETVANLTLDAAGRGLDTVKVMAQRVFTSRRLQEFEQRRKRGFGYFMDADNIDKRNPMFVADLFRTIPGVLFSRGAFGDQVLLRGTGFQRVCAPTVFIDGMRVFNPDGNLDGMLNVQDISAMEVYTRGSSMPVEFQTLEGCGALVFWTGGRRQGR